MVLEGLLRSLKETSLTHFKLGLLLPAALVYPNKVLALFVGICSLPPSRGACRLLPSWMAPAAYAVSPMCGF